MDPNARFLRDWFRRYYSGSSIEPPDRFGRREFGFMFFDRNFMQRHTAFSRTSELEAFLRASVPAHCYYSTAYYQSPGAATMEEKTWLGADLIFDLDADHLKGAERMTYTEMLDKVRVEMIRLLDEFLFGDLGFSTDEVRIVFSGGRGYHAHVCTPKVLSLGSHERREIVDYITANSLEMSQILEEVTTVTKEFRDNKRVYKTINIPEEGRGGWWKKVRRGIIWALEAMESMNVEGVRQRFPSVAGESDRAIQGMLRDLYSDEKGRRGMDIILEKDNLSSLTTDARQKVFLSILKDVIPDLVGEVDEPVTSDVKRLIRLPGSLHGKSGLRVSHLTRDDMDTFLPLRDAVPEVYDDSPTMVVMRERTDISIRDERFSLEGETEVPAYAAVFLIARKMASLAE